MTPSAALTECCRDSNQRFRYEIRDGEDWQTPEETERRGAGCCRDFARWAIHRVYPLFRDCEWRIVIGDARGRRHAWVELIDAEGRRWWGDPTPGYDYPVSSPSAWVRTPLWAYPCDEFGPRDKMAY